MSEQTFFNGLITGWFVLAGIIFITLLFFAAPYGRHIRTGWGFAISNKLAWAVMEAPAALVFAVCLVLGNRPIVFVSWLFLCLWEAHYVHRAFIYPFSLVGKAKQMPIVIMISGIFFNTVNAYINGRYIYTFSGGYTGEWLVDPRFIIGLMLFITGFIINRRADYTLRRLRRSDESGYKIPYGNLYRWISCPNYYGEIIIWIGWAVATWSLPGLAFAVWTVANLVPRAWSHHKWYHEHFPEYPPERRVLVPMVW